MPGPLVPGPLMPCPPHALPPRAQAEKHLSDLVVGGALAAKIDRPAGIVRFSHAK